MSETKELFKAIAEFQQEVPVIHKGTEGYGYSYADLAEIFDKIKPILKAKGLGFVQFVMGTQLSTTVFHIESGQEITALADIPQDVELSGMNPFQVLGSGITYMRRYQLSAMLGLVTDKDTDAAGGKKPSKSKQPDLDEDGNEKPWLNEGKGTWDDVVEWVARGNDIDRVRDKYKVSKANWKALNEAVDKKKKG